MRKACLERDLSAIMADAAALADGANELRIGGIPIPCEPGQPWAGLSPDIAGEWGDSSTRVIVRTADMPTHCKVGDTCLYGGERRRISGIERNVDGLTCELTLSGVK